MLKSVLSFGVGVCAGILISQNCDLPRMDPAHKLADKVKTFIDDQRKPKH